MSALARGSQPKRAQLTAYAGVFQTVGAAWACYTNRSSLCMWLRPEVRIRIMPERRILVYPTMEPYADCL